MKQASLLPLLYDSRATGGWTAGMVQVTLAMLHGVPIRPGAVVLEVGCGLGAVARAVQNARPAARVIGAELHPLALRAVEGSRPAFIQGDLLHLPLPPASVDLLLALDSFDQVGVDLNQALAEAQRVLRPNGLLLLRVSAHPRLQGTHDTAFNTGRRYTLAELHNELLCADYEPKRISYANTLLAPPTVALRLLDRLRNRAMPTHWASAVYASATANAAIQAALALESLWLCRANLPIGLSLLVLATKRELASDSRTDSNIPVWIDNQTMRA